MCCFCHGLKQNEILRHTIRIYTRTSNRRQSSARCQVWLVNRVSQHLHPMVKDSLSRDVLWRLAGRCPQIHRSLAKPKPPSYMSKTVKGSWSRVKDALSWSSNYDRIFNYEKTSPFQKNPEKNQPANHVAKQGSRKNAR